MDNVLNRILALLESSDSKKKDFLSAIGLSKSALSDWTSGKSESYKKYISKIATYFNVTTDYLLGNEQKNKPSAEAEGLTIKEKQLLMAFRNMTDDAQDSFLNIAVAASAKIAQEGKK